MSNVNSFDDPFTRVYDALWTCVVEHPYLGAVFKVGNRVDLIDKRAFVKEKLASADLPELLLIPQSLKGNLHASSSSSSVIKRYQWVMTSGDYRVDKYLFPISWAIYTSMVRCQKILTTLKMDGDDKTFVRRADLIDSTDGQSQAQRDSNIKGWSTVQTIEVEMYFTTTDLIVGATPEVP